MYTLKSIAQRGTMLGAAVALVAAAVMPSASVLAAELNPLTERSLLLSSSAPGWQDTDGSGYSTSAGNPATGVNGTPATYAPAGSGPNGKKTGETFSFKTSTTGVVKGFTFQYCTSAAGKCQAPGNNGGDADPDKDGDTTDSTRHLNNSSDPAEGWNAKKSDLNVTPGFTEGAGAGQFEIKVGGVAQTGWTFETSNKETADHTGAKTGTNNYITLHKAGETAPINGGTKVEITFKASESVYITNPGAGAFFVKLNTYDSATLTDHVPGGTHNIDGGVTVANVMTDSIHITTKVLETMSFSVGTQNPDTVVKSNPADHGTCENMTSPAGDNRLNLGDPDAENSLETGKAHDAFSYWRLSSNSSGGATVYYSGNTLANTVGDEIADMTTKGASLPGKEQFGLGFVDVSALPANQGDTFSSSFLSQVSSEPTRYKLPSSYPFITVTGQSSTAPFTGLTNAQPTSANYTDATGTIDNGSGGAGTAQFMFKKTSSTVPEPIAQENETVISCATAKMRYVGNIAADTPAGVYTTKINYLAAPQY